MVGDLSQLTLFALEAPARTSVSQDDEPDSPERVPACSSRRPELLVNAVQLLHFGRTYPVPLVPTLAEISQWSSVSFANSGRVTSRGELLTLSTQECLNGVGASFLSRTLQSEPVPAKYFLSPTAAKGILRRAERRGKALPPRLEQALTELAATAHQAPT